MFQETMNLAARRYRLLKECSKHHKKAKGKVDVQRLHIGNFWQSPGKYLNILLVFKTKDFSRIPIDSPHECDHGEDGGDAKPNSRRGRTTVQVETHLRPHI